uniref:Uncharacterized protein n=1 Tax=Grammatophora oceanica TaxID=210454 RepID=A0A7S1V4I4_9STRA|mmetsp:Transcript_365/g.495  ORF Transcript_365/g.495 Transcript_365/m.495 type:complete len:347 (+) Transcript_365:96-1136(+)
MTASKQRTANDNNNNNNNEDNNPFCFQQSQEELSHPPFVMFSSSSRTDDSSTENEILPASHVRFSSLSSIGSLSTTDWSVSGIHVIAEEMELDETEDDEHLISPSNNTSTDAESPAPTPTISNRKNPKTSHRQSSLAPMTPNYNNFGTTLHDVDSEEETSPLVSLYRKAPPSPPASPAAASLLETKALFEVIYDDKENIEPSWQNGSTKLCSNATTQRQPLRRRSLRNRSNTVYPFDERKPTKTARPTKKVMFRSHSEHIPSVSFKTTQTSRSRSAIPSFRHRRDSATSLPSPSRLGMDKVNIGALLRGDSKPKSPVLEEYRRKRASLNQVLPLRYPGLKASVHFR